jgi:Leucine-rich repeat (LRR) protein
VINLRDNLISYLYPNSFNIHRRLRKINLSKNKLSFFPTEIISNSKLLEYINLSWNKLSSLESADFSNMYSLKHLDLSLNEVSFLPPFSFSNCSLLSHLNLSHNRISSIGDTAFKGIARLSLDLSHNDLSSLPVDAFHRKHVFLLTDLDLSFNNFSVFPAPSLRKQYSVLEELNLSNNRLSTLPSNSDVLVNLKKIDLSYNPLTSDSIATFFSEPKSVRVLNVANTGISTIASTIEMPFLKKINLSSNSLTALTPEVFAKTSLLKLLDLSSNKVSKLNVQLPSSIWKKLPSLKMLSLSSNPIQNVLKGDLDSLLKLTSLDLSNLTAMNHFECEALTPMNHLESLFLFGYPFLERLEVQECITYINLKSLRKLSLEFKESSIQGHLQRLFYYSKLRKLLITGSSLSSISASSFIGLKSEEIDIAITGTKIKELPDTIFSNLLVTTKINMDLSRNQIASVSNNFVKSLDNKLMTVRISGLETNQIVCDCRSEPLWKWINLRMKLNPNVKYYNSFLNQDNITCALPTSLHGLTLTSLEAEQLSCDNRISTAGSTTTTTMPTPVIIVGPKRTQPSINKIRIDSENYLYDNKIRRTSSGLETIHKNQKNKQTIDKQTVNSSGNSRNNAKVSGTNELKKSPPLTRVDTMIIGIVGGVVAFLCILILIICIMKVRTSISSTTRLNHMPPVMTGMTKGCTCASLPGPCQSCSLSSINSNQTTYTTARSNIPSMSNGNQTVRPLSVYGTTGPMRPMNYTMKVNPVGYHPHQHNNIRRVSNGHSPKNNSPGNSYFIYSDIPEEGFK